MRTNRGMVLISVLWVILVLSLVSFSLASAVRVEVSAAQHAFDSERAFFMAKGVVEVVYGRFSKKEEFPADSPVRLEKGEYVFPFESGEARVRFESAGGLIDINAASDILLASLFDSLGVTQEQRNRLVDSVLDWRDADDIPHLYGAEVSDYPAQPMVPRNGDFKTVEEVLLVKNMTPQIFYGSLTFNPVTQQFQRVPGLRELITVQSGRDQINPNIATVEVLAALPEMNIQIAAQIVREREKKSYENSEELITRVPDMFRRPALDYLSFDPTPSNMIVSRATIASSGISRTVRLSLIREEKVLIYSTSPLFFRKVEEFRRGRWWFD